jgi:competence protein CoiA
MRFALLNDNRIEATKGVKGVCPCCGSELVAKCGEIKVHHWSHKKKCDDHWWENETEWHRNWKNEFPIEWQEVIHKDESGEKHIADVKTDEDWVVEFQHSVIASEERNSRDQFYKKLIWVVDGTRRKTDVKQFQKVLNDNAHMDRPSGKLLHLGFPHWSSLLMEWGDSNSLILLDFKDRFSSNEDLLLIYPRMYEDKVFVSQLSRSVFIKYLNNNKFDEIIDKVINPIRITVEHSIKKMKRGMKH